MQRDYKLSSYSLNSVSAHFLSEQVRLKSCYQFFFVLSCLSHVYAGYMSRRIYPLFSQIDLIPNLKIKRIEVFYLFMLCLLIEVNLIQGKNGHWWCSFHLCRKRMSTIQLYLIYRMEIRKPEDVLLYTVWRCIPRIFGILCCLFLNRIFLV